MKYSYVSLITSDSYVPGLVALHHSLKKTKPVYPFVALVAPVLSRTSLKELDAHHISYRVIDHMIENPTDVDVNHRWHSTYFKLHIFNLTEFEKIVYLDADMLVLRNIDNLFKASHLSATNAGGMLPRKSFWKHINTGLLVIEPDRGVFLDMLNLVGKVENLKSEGTVDRPIRGSDQDFLNAYYPDWPTKKNLHLNHKYNIFHYYLDEYNQLFGYTIEDGRNPIFIIHYASYLKPWNTRPSILERIKADPERILEYSAIELWQGVYDEAKTNL
ncbi:MAG: glycosyltransferase [bacterium]|nr:glycosyltransferase [bacterium]